MSFKEYDKLALSAIAKEVVSEWKEANIFQKSIESRPAKKQYVFYEGPPSANGKPGIHHLMARVIKDIFCRYKTLKGYRVERKAGWDTHGLPVELGVEKELGISKEDIGKKISVEEYNTLCKKSVMRYTELWNDLTEKMGFWLDMDNPYITYDAKYIESVWWLLHQIYSKDLLYKGYTIQPYSPKAGTGLSSHELNQPGTYRIVKDTSITAQFKALPESLPSELQKDTTPLYFLAWTTTPWTLPSNTALAVGKKLKYSVVKTYNAYTHKSVRLVFAEALEGKLFGKKYTCVDSEATLSAYKEGDKSIPYLKIATVQGVELVGSKYEQIWSESPKDFDNAENAFRVISGDFVTTEEGTGIVHIAPTFGADDALVAKQATPEIPALLVKDENNQLAPLVDLQGRFRKEVGTLGGKYVKNEYYEPSEMPDKSVDVEIAITLKEENKAFNVEKYAHSYPHCWRTDKPILYYPLDSWFIKISSVRDRLVELNEGINWKPAHTGEKRFKRWLENANDWNLSRSRFWGIPLPVWRTEDKKETLVIESVEDLIANIKKSIDAGVMTSNPFDSFEVGDMSAENYAKIDLHKHIVDKIVLVSPSGKPMYREADLIDVWFDSGSMPYAQWHYPFENKEKIETNEKHPADFIAEGVDQTRGWFYTLHAISSIVFDKPAYKNVVSNGLVLDKEGRKMSKRLGNSVDPFEILNTYGADASRWYMISNANPWDDLKFDERGIKEVQNNFFGTLYNTYSFFSLYANVDNFTYKEASIPLEERNELDQWILSELNTLIQKVDSAYESYEPTTAARSISEFTQELLSNWYVRLSRRRFWKGTYEKDKIAAYQTLYECLLTLSKLMSPVAPMYADVLYKDLVSATQKETFESVHLSSFPEYNAQVVRADLESQMKKARNITSQVLSLRKKERLKVRQPLQKIKVAIVDDKDKEVVLKVKDLILRETNVKELELLDGLSSLVTKKMKPIFSVLGASSEYKQHIPAIMKASGSMQTSEINEIEQNIEKGEAQYILYEGGKMEVKLSGEDKNMTIEPVGIEGWETSDKEGITIALDTRLTDTLKQEGIVRELINKIQNYRKDIDLKITDRINIYIENKGDIGEAVNNNVQYIQEETLCDELVFENEMTKGISVSLGTLEINVLIEKI